MRREMRLLVTFDLNYAELYLAISSGNNLFYISTAQCGLCKLAAA